MLKDNKMIRNTEIQSSNNKNRLKSIDIIKGIAILMIIFVHSTQKFPNLNGILKGISRYGQMGCQAFFLISGFTLCLSASRKGLHGFYKSRFINIAPGYYFMIILYLILNTIIGVFNLPVAVETNTTWIGIVVNLLFLNGVIYKYNNNVVPGGWYIGTIAIFYLIFPFIYKVLEKIKSKKILYALPYIVGIFSLVIQIIFGIYKGTSIYSQNNSFIYFSILNQLPCMLLGMILFYKYKDGKLSEYTPKTSLFKAIIWMIISMILFYSEIPFIFSIIPLTATKSFYWIFIYINYNINKIKSGLQNFLANWGNISYEAFLVHVVLVYYIPTYLIFILKYLELNIDDTLLYAIIILPLYILTFYLAKKFKKALTKIQDKLRNILLKNKIN